MPGPSLKSQVPILVEDSLLQAPGQPLLMDTSFQTASPHDSDREGIQGIMAEAKSFQQNLPVKTSEDEAQMSLESMTNCHHSLEIILLVILLFSALALFLAGKLSF